MNLCLDIGNTRAKLALFNNLQLQKTWSVEVNGLRELLESIKTDHPSISHSILAASGKVPEEISNLLYEIADVKLLDSDWHLPFQNAYATPETLGKDRLALVAAASYLYKNKDCLIIDAGTCVTYDFLNAKGHYLGGAITPGLRMRYHAMHEQTERLPLLDTEYTTDLIGDSTNNSIHSGAVNGFILEMDGWIDTYRAQHQDLTVILTGGDTDFLSKRLKNAIFAHSNFLLKGLNYLLEINKV